MTRHLIDELVFEIAADGGNRVVRDDAWLRRMVTSTMLPVVEETLDAFDQADTVLVLPMLELDLGAIGQADYEQLAPQRLRAALDDALHRALASAREPDGAAGAGSGASIVSREDADIADLTRFLDTGTLPWHADPGQARLHEALLERLLARGGASLWKLLAEALADPRRARRLSEQFPQRQLEAVARGIAAERTGQAAAAGAPLSELDLMADFLEGGVLHPEDGGPPGAHPHEAMLDRLLAQGGVAFPNMMRRVLAAPRSARRFVAQFPERQRLAVLRMLAACVDEGGAAGVQARQDGKPARTHWTPAAGMRPAGWQSSRRPVPGRPRPVRAAGGLAGAPAPSLQQQASARPGLVRGTRQPYQAQLAHFARFLESGLLPPAAVAGAAVDGRHAHEALLDDLLEHADEALWVVLARALERDDSTARLLGQFPQRQLLALCRQSAPGYAGPLERLLRRLPALGTRQGADSERLGQRYWRHALAACLARPATRALPAHVCARALLDLGGRPEPDAGIVYARSVQDDAPVSPWRPGRDERRAGRALLRLTDLVGAAVSSWDPHVATMPALVSAPAADFSADGREPAAVLAREPGDEPVFLRARARMARSLHGLCRELEAALQEERAARGTGSAGAAGEITVLRARIAAQVETKPAIAPQRRLNLLDAIDAASREKTDPVRFLRGVQAALDADAPLDLDAVPAATPLQMLAAALKDGDAAAAVAQCRTLLRSHGPQVRDALRHYGRNISLRRALAKAIPDAVFIDLAGLFDVGAPAILRALLTPSPALQTVLGSGAAWNAWTARCRLQALTGWCGAAVVNGRLTAAGFLRAVAPADSERHAALCDALPEQFRSEFSSPAKADSPDGRSPECPPSYGAQLGHFARFLESGLLPPAAVAGTGAEGMQAHEALLDVLLARADDALWEVVAGALAREDSTVRLLRQFPQRQLMALCRKSAPACADQLERLFFRLMAMQGRPAMRSGLDRGDARLTPLWWRHVLAACVTRPAAPLSPARLCARIALDLDLAVMPASDGTTGYARRGDGDAAASFWRPSRDERRAGRALLRLADMLAPAVSSWDEGVDMDPAPALAPLDAVSDSGPGAAADETATLRARIAAQVDSGPAIAPQRRQALLDAVDATAREVGDVPGFLRRVLAALRAGAALDLNALAAADASPAATDGPPVAADGSPGAAELAAPAVPARPAAPAAGLTPRQRDRERPTRPLHDPRHEPEAALQDENAAHGTNAVSAADDIVTLRTRIAAQVETASAIAPQRRQALLAAVDATAREVGDAPGFLRRVLAALRTGVPLDIDALAAADASPAATDGPAVAADGSPGAAELAAPAAPTHPAAPAAGLIPRERDRERIARPLRNPRHEPEAALQDENATRGTDAVSAADDIVTLRARIAAQVETGSAIAPQRRQALLSAVDATAREVGDAPGFLRRVLAALRTGAALDIDALATADASPAADDALPAAPEAAALGAQDHPAAPAAGLVLRERERMARSLAGLCRELEAALREESAVRETADPARFPPNVQAALNADAPLDGDAAPAATPMQMLAAALKDDDAVAAVAQCWTLLRSHGPQVRDALRHYGRNITLRRALAKAIPNAVFIDLAGLFDAGAAAILRAMLTPSPALRAALGSGAAWDAWTARCRLQALTEWCGAAAGTGRLTAAAFLRAVAPAENGAHAALCNALPAQFRPDADAATLTKESPTPTPTPTPAPQVRAAPRLLRPAPAPKHARAAAAPVPSAQADAALADPTDMLVVANAGMVLAAPYLPRLFKALGLTADGAFVDEQAAGRAVHLLQFMVTGEAQTPEYELVLNKILCGVPTATPVPAGIDITQAEQDTIEGMVQAMVAHAKVLGKCSVAAMRQTFFARTADLHLVDDAWHLRVHPGTFDMLLDRLPWGYSIVKFGWMPRPVHVEWRPT